MSAQHHITRPATRCAAAIARVEQSAAQAADAINTFNTTLTAAKAQKASKSVRAQIINIAEASAARNAWAAGQVQRARRTPATAQRMRYSTAANTYQGTELQPYTGRPGSLDFLDCPSLIGNRRVYRADAPDKAK